MYDLVIIGAGPGGYVAAIRAAQLGLSVAVMEKNRPGGTCLNRGCIPTKAYYQNARLLRDLHRSHLFGIETARYTFDMAQAHQRKQQVVQQLASGVEQLLKAYKVQVVSGEACLQDTRSVRVGEQTIAAGRILIASGSLPRLLPIQGAGHSRIMTSDEALEMTEIPPRLAVIGGGVIGLEFACIFRTFGSEVTVFESQSTILPLLDREITKRMALFLKRQGIAVHTSVVVHRFAEGASGMSVHASGPRGEVTVEADCVLQAGGRKPCTGGLKLEQLGIRTDPHGFIKVDEHYETSAAGVYAIGDVIGGQMLAHVASEEGIAAVEHMAGRSVHVPYHAVPSTLFTFPEIATVGISEEEARASGLDVRIGRFSFAANGKALTMGETDGLVKVIADRQGTLMGVHIIGPHASDLIAEAAVAVSNRLQLKTVLETIHAHPTLAEAFKEAVLDVTDEAIHLAPVRKRRPS